MLPASAESGRAAAAVVAAAAAATAVAVMAAVAEAAADQARAPQISRSIVRVTTAPRTDAG